MFRCISRLVKTIFINSFIPGLRVRHSIFLVPGTRSGNTKYRKNIWPSKPWAFLPSHNQDWKWYQTIPLHTLSLYKKCKFEGPQNLSFSIIQKSKSGKVFYMLTLNISTLLSLAKNIVYFWSWKNKLRKVWGVGEAIHTTNDVRKMHMFNQSMCNLFLSIILYPILS